MDTQPRKYKTFSLTQRTIEALLGLDGTAICAALVLACFTDRTGIYSTAGVAAVSRYIGVGRPKARKAVDKLASNRVLRKVIHSTKVPDGPKSGPSAYRYVFKEDTSTPIWFSGSLVEGVGKFRTPLSTLLRLGSEAVRALLYMHLYEDMATWGGVAPFPAIFREYKPSGECNIPGHRNMVCRLVVKGEDKAYVSFQRAVITLEDETTDEEDETTDEQWKIFWRALEGLQNAGFLYEVITVTVGEDLDHEDGMALYHLHTINRYGHPPKGEENLSGAVANALKSVGKCVPNFDGKFYGVYGFIVPEHMEEITSVIGVYRLRFRAVHPKSSESRDSWAAIQSRQALARSWIKAFAGGEDT